MIAANPGVTFAPAIDADFQFNFIAVKDSQGRYKFQYNIQGGHDGFPAYEIYVNQQQVYTYDPRSTNLGTAAGPLGLFYSFVDVAQDFQEIPG